jgi:hypothetical protein
MAARSRAGAPLTALWLLTRPHLRRDRSRRPIGPVVEALEGRLLLARTAPTDPVPVGPQVAGTPNAHQIGAAYRETLVIQTTTLQSLGDSDREVQTAGAQLASRTDVAVAELNAHLTQITSQDVAGSIAAAIRRDRHLLDLGGADVARVEHGLDVARGIADQQANGDEIDIANGVFPTLEAVTQFVDQYRSTGTALARSGRRSENALVRELSRLGDQLTSTIEPHPSS